MALGNDVGNRFLHILDVKPPLSSVRKLPLITAIQYLLLKPCESDRHSLSVSFILFFFLFSLFVYEYNLSLQKFN